MTYKLPKDHDTVVVDANNQVVRTYKFSKQISATKAEPMAWDWDAINTVKDKVLDKMPKPRIRPEVNQPNEEVF
jgi:hypothetical protein